MEIFWHAVVIRKPFSPGCCRSPAPFDPDALVYMQTLEEIISELSLDGSEVHCIEPVRARPGMMICNDCGAELPESQFRRHKLGSASRMSCCTKCYKKRYPNKKRCGSP